MKGDSRLLRILPSARILLAPIILLIFNGCAVNNASAETASRLTIPSPVEDLHTEGAAATQRGDLQAARQKYEAALKLSKTMYNTAAEALTLVKIGEVEFRMGNDASAIEALDQALAIGQALLQGASEEEKQIIVSYRAEGIYLKAEAIKGSGNPQQR